MRHNEYTTDAFRRVRGGSIMLSVKLTALPSPWTRAPALRPTENWLRRRYPRIAVVTLVLLLLNEFHRYGIHLRAWDWLYVSGWITFLSTFNMTFMLPDKVDETLRRLAGSQVLYEGENKLSDFKQGLHESSRRAARVGGVIVAAVLVLGWILAKRGAFPSYFVTVLLEMVGAFWREHSSAVPSATAASANGSRRKVSRSTSTLST